MAYSVLTDFILFNFVSLSVCKYIDTCMCVFMCVCLFISISANWNFKYQIVHKSNHESLGDCECENEWSLHVSSDTQLGLYRSWIPIPPLSSSPTSQYYVFCYSANYLSYVFLCEWVCEWVSVFVYQPKFEIEQHRSIVLIFIGKLVRSMSRNI